jgi:o-succinylbenzoate synthase
MNAHYFKHQLQFIRPSGTSRGILTTKDSWFIVLEHEEKRGIGECSLLKGLSIDAVPHFEQELKKLCDSINNQTTLPNLTAWPSIRMGYEMALLDLSKETPYLLFPSEFTEGKSPIPINGLVWMGSLDYMKSQIKSLLERGFDCIKLKIGTLDFKKELQLLKQVRNEFKAQEITLRVDANGAFSPKNALEKLKQLSDYDLHSIEQPIAVNQWDIMSKLCEQSPVPIALDEELIGCFSEEKQQGLLDTIKPDYLIIKPSLLGGFQASDQWIALAKKNGIGWWITSALESNIGLNAIAQWTFKIEAMGHQGLGTGSLFKNNISSPLKINVGCLWNDNLIPWEKFY